MQEVLKELIHLVPLWFLLISIVFFGLYYVGNKIYKCIEKIILRTDMREKERFVRYQEMNRIYREALNNNTKAFNDFSVNFSKIKEEIEDVKALMQIKIK